MDFLAFSTFGFIRSATVFIHVVDTKSVFKRFRGDLTGDFLIKKTSSASLELHATLSPTNVVISEGSTIAFEIAGQRFESVVKKNMRAKGWKIRVSEQGFVEVRIKIPKVDTGLFFEYYPTTIPVFLDFGLDEFGTNRMVGIPFDTYYEESGKSKMKFFGRF